MATLVEALAERTSAQRVPIPGGVPAGTDLSFDPDFAKIKGEIDKLTSIAGAQPNWREVIDTSETLLATKTKDLRLATWVAVAKMNQTGWQGFAEGLSVYHALVKDFWDTMFPEVKRARGRANLYTWLGEQVAIYFDPKDVTASDGDAVKACDELLKEIDTMLSEKLGDLHPGPGKLRGTMRTKVMSIPAEAPPPPPPTEAPSASASPAPAAASAPVESPSLGGGSTDDAVQAVRACGKTIMDAARVLRRNDPAQPWPYRIQRVGLWIAVQQPPPAEGGKTRLPPPPVDVQKKIEAQTAAEKWLDVLNTAEDATATSLYWFDLHRYAALAMDRLGANFMAAREVLGREVTGFLARFPSLLDLSFSSGRPFADAGTKAWLEEEGKKWGAATGGGGGSSAASAAANAEDEELSKRFEEARGMVSGGKVGDGLALAVALANRGADARMRFRAHLTVARFALEGGKPEIAKPVLEALLGQIDQYGLESWEPSLCATVYTYLLTSLKTAKGANKNPESIAKEGFLFDKLCRLDPAAALRLAGS